MPIKEVKPPDTDNVQDDAPEPEKRQRRRQPGSAKLKEQVAELYATIGLMVVTPIDRLGGVLLVKQADEIAELWVKLAEADPRVKKILLKMVEIEGWGGIIMAHGMIAMPVLANRGMLPDNLAGPVAAATVMQHGEDIAPLFTHPRFGRKEKEASQPVNGNGTPQQGTEWEPENKG